MANDRERAYVGWGGLTWDELTVLHAEGSEWLIPHYEERRVERMIRHVMRSFDAGFREFGINRLIAAFVGPRLRPRRHFPWMPRRVLPRVLNDDANGDDGDDGDDESNMVE